jgi:hypothetical protein
MKDEITSFADLLDNIAELVNFADEQLFSVRYAIAKMKSDNARTDITPAALYDANMHARSHACNGIRNLKDATNRLFKILTSRNTALWAGKFTDDQSAMAHLILKKPQAMPALSQAEADGVVPPPPQEFIRDNARRIYDCYKNDQAQALFSEADMLG